MYLQQEVRQRVHYIKLLEQITTNFINHKKLNVER